jgi:hypothetical protein
VYHYEFSTPFVDLPLDIRQPATHFCEDLEGKDKGRYETRKERTPTLSTPRQQPADKPTHWSFLPETLPDVKPLDRLKSKNGGSFRPLVFSSQRDLQQRRRPRSLHPQDPTPGQPAAKDEHSAEFLRIVEEFPYAAAFHQEPPRARGRPHAPSCVLRRTAPAGAKIAWSAATLFVQITQPYFSSSSSQW